MGKSNYYLNPIYEKLFPINRSLTGDGNRKTLNIISEIIPININDEQNTDFSMGIELIPNYRKLTHSMIFNLFQKILIQNTNTKY